MKKRLATLMVAGTMTMSLLTACSSKQETAAPANNETTKAEATEETPTAEQVEEEVAESAPTTEPESTTEEVAEEPESEPETEAVVYEGIDMESTLPGIEWMDTFDGIIHEPKMVVFNDETNKKVIVENEDIVEFSLTDTMAIYIPSDRGSSTQYLISGYFVNRKQVGRYIIQTELQSGAKKIGSELPYKDLAVYGEDEVKLSAKLKIVE